MWAVWLLALVWLLPGLFGSEPWKPDGAYTFGLISHISATGDWVVPTLAGEPFMEKPPLFFITAALFNNLFSGWLSPPDAMRLATGFYIGLALIALSFASREIFGRGYGRWAVILLLGCIGFPVRAHQLITDTALFAGMSWGLYGLALAPRRPWLAGIALGAGVTITTLAKGLIGPGLLGVAALSLPMFFSRYRHVSYLKTLLGALLVGSPLPLLWMIHLYHRDPVLFRIWWWDNNFGRFFGANHLGPRAERGFYFKLIPWYGLPAWPLAIFGAWRAARRGHLARLAAPFTLFVMGFLVLSVSADARELYAMPLLAPLVVLAVAGVLPCAELRRMGRGFWFLLALLVLGALLLGGFALATGLPKPVYGWMGQSFVGWTPHWVVGAWIAALIALICLGLLWRVAPMQRLSGSLWRWSVLFTGIWAMLGTLFLPALDLQMGYRHPFSQLRPWLLQAQQTDCVASMRLGEPQRALLAYYAATVTRRIESRPDAGQCRWLLIQSENAWRPAGLEGVAPQVVVSRPGDSRERYPLYYLPGTVGQLLRGK